MKINFQRIARRLSLTFELVFLFSICQFSLCQVSAQNLTKTFVKEIRVSEDSEITTNTPEQMDKGLHGDITTNYTAKAYAIYGKNENLVLYVDRNYEIKTWDKNVVKQEVEVTIVPENPTEAQLLMDNLEIDLVENPAKEVNVDASLNIKKFEMRNGFMKGNKSMVQLEGGAKYEIKTLYLKATLTIPKVNDLTVESRYSLLKIGDMIGDLNLDIYYSEIDIGHVKNLRANLNSCFNAFFKTIEVAQISAKNSSIRIDKINVLNVGFVELMEDCKSNDATNSSISEYRIKDVQVLNIAETKNDKFILGRVGKLSSPASVFSNYEIKNLDGGIDLTARSGDLTVREVGKDFGHIDINNEISTVILNMGNDTEYLINVYKNPTSEYFLPDNLKLIKEEKDWKSTYLKGDKNKAGEIDIRCEKCKVVFQN